MVPLHPCSCSRIVDACLLSYVCKSVSASDGISPRTEVDTAKTSGPQGTSKLLTRDVYSLPHPKSILERSLPRPAPPQQGAFHCWQRNVIHVPCLKPWSPWHLSLAMTSFRSVCPSSQPWFILRKGSLVPGRADDGGAMAASNCPCPCLSEKVDGAVRFLKFCTKFSFVITPHFYLTIYLLWLLFLNSKLVKK